MEKNKKDLEKRQYSDITHEMIAQGTAMVAVEISKTFRVLAEYPFIKATLKSEIEKNQLLLKALKEKIKLNKKYIDDQIYDNKERRQLLINELKDIKEFIRSLLSIQSEIRKESEQNEATKLFLNNINQQIVELFSKYSELVDKFEFRPIATIDL